MLGQMMKMPLTIGALVEHAGTYHGDTEIVSVETQGGIARRTWGQTETRARQLASALRTLGVEASARCGTLAWNNYRHLETYFGVASGGMICHTLNPRLHVDMMSYVINHAEDQVLFVDKTFVPLVVRILDRVPCVKTVILLGPRDEETLAAIPDILFYDEFIETGDAGFIWPDFDENTASSLCYTSGTTGNPKGVLYSHRSTVLHSFMTCLPDSANISATSVLLPAVPMFHVNAWGVPYAAAMTGAKLILPGPGLDGDSLIGLIDAEKVTCALGVPTIWQGLLTAAAKSNSKLESLVSTVIGGAACPPSMIAEFRDRYAVDTVHAWGMTETSPIASINQLLSKHLHLSDDEKAKNRTTQGRPPFGVSLAVLDAEASVVPMDGTTEGTLVCKGHWIVDAYFGKEPGSAHDDGWFDTGDIATLDENGFVTIRDRAKDLIKSGGEWISSVELENIAVSHPKVLAAAAIGAKHPKWDERPVLIVVKAEDCDPTEQEIQSYYAGKIASWQVPDKVIFVDQLPMNATGKVVKKTCARCGIKY